MSETTAPVETPITAPARTKLKIKTKVKKTVVASSNGKAVRDRSMADAPASARRLALVKVLRKYQATKTMSAKPISFLADKLGYSVYDVYCLAYSKYPLAVNGFVKTVKLEGSKELSIYLTAKGVKTDPE